MFYKTSKYSKYYNSFERLLQFLGKYVSLVLDLIPAIFLTYILTELPLPL